MILPLLLIVAAQADTPSPEQARHDACIGLATADPKAAEGEAGRWRLAGGGFLARQCMGIAYANQQRWAAAAGEFEAAARAAEVAGDRRAAGYWAQAGNGWAAAKDIARARAALDAALAAGTLTGLQRGEAYLDRARVQMDGGDLEGARADADRALADAADDPFAWLVSARLARRMDDLPRAGKDIAEALRRAGDDALVQLEAGNIAAKAGDAAGAKEAWRNAARIDTTGGAGAEALAALKQFESAP